MKHKLLLFATLFTPIALFAQIESEKISIRKERNTFEVSTGLEGSLNSLNDAWIATSGGDNSVTVSTSLFMKHKYVKGKLSVESSFSAKYGYYNVSVERVDADSNTYEENVWFKNQDEFAISIAPAFAMSKNWSYGASLGFRSQFADGYLSSSSQEKINLKSAFLSPGYLNFSLGVNYQYPSEKFPIKVSLSPLAMSGIFVSNEIIRTNALYEYKEHIEDNYKYTDPYGVSPYDSSKFEGGSSIQIDFDRKFGKNATFRYMTTIFSFYGWISNIATDNGYCDYKKYEAAISEWNETNEGDKPVYLVKPNLRWVNRLEIKATKYLYTNVNFELYYDRSQNVNIQTKTILSLGMSYKFTNK